MKVKRKTSEKKWKRKQPFHETCCVLSEKPLSNVFSLWLIPLLRERKQKIVSTRTSGEVKRNIQEKQCKRRNWSQAQEQAMLDYSHLFVMLCESNNFVHQVKCNDYIACLPWVDFGHLRPTTQRSNLFLAQKTFWFLCLKEIHKKYMKSQIQWTAVSEDNHARHGGREIQARPSGWDKDWNCMN